MRMTVKGQVTIPKYVRDALDIKPGDEVDWVLEDDSARITRRSQESGKEIVARMAGKANANLGMTTDEIMALLRGHD